jgi:hypothetical protein
VANLLAHIGKKGAHKGRPNAILHSTYQTNAQAALIGAVSEFQFPDKLICAATSTVLLASHRHGAYWNVIKSVRLNVVDFGFRGSFARLALPAFKI